MLKNDLIFDIPASYDKVYKAWTKRIKLIENGSKMPWKKEFCKPVKAVQDPEKIVLSEVLFQPIHIVGVLTWTGPDGREPEQYFSTKAPLLVVPSRISTKSVEQSPSKLKVYEICLSNHFSKLIIKSYLNINAYSFTHISR